MKTFIGIVLTLGLLAVAAFAQPSVGGVTNGASFSLPPLQNSSIAQGSYFTIFGTGLSADISSCGANYTNCIWHPYPLPTSMQGTTVNVTVGSTTVPAYIEFAYADQINAVMPSNTPTGTGTLTVKYNGATSNAFNITVAAASFGTFTYNEAGTGPGVITDTNYVPLTPFHTVKPGDYVLLWGTGLGPAPNLSTEQTAAPPQTNLCATAANCPVTVWVGGQQASVPYAGRSGFTAEDQIVFIVPPGLQGCYVQVAVQTGTVISNFTSMPVDPGRATCSDTDGINFNDIASVVQSKGQANIGNISLLSNYVPINFLGETIQFDNDLVEGGFATFTSGQLAATQGFTISPSVGNCVVTPFQGLNPTPVDPVLAQVTYLNAGSQLSIAGGQGPNGTQSVPLGPDGKAYAALVGGAYIACPASNPSCPSLFSGTGLAPYFLDSTSSGGTFTPTGIAAATYTVSGPGGSTVGQFSGTINVSSAAASFKWTNQSIASSPIPRDQPLQINWSGGDPNDFVDITLIASTTTAAVPTSSTPGVVAECIAPGSVTSFTVPTYVLGALPSTSTASPIAGELLVGPASGAQKLSSTLPTGLDALYVYYHFISGLPVALK